MPGKIIMNASFTLASDQDAALTCLDQARKHHTQAAIAKYLDIDVRTIRRWEARETHPPAYVAHALQQMLPFGDNSAASSGFICKITQRSIAPRATDSVSVWSGPAT
jgi:hypothetical protein